MPNNLLKKPIMQKSFWMLLAAFLFSVMAAFTKWGAQDFSTMELVFYRSLFGVIVMFLWVKSRHQSVKTPLAWAHIKRSFLGTLGMTIWFFAIGSLPLGTAMTLNYTSPLYMALIVTVLGFKNGHPVRATTVLSVLLGFLGVVLVLKPELHAGQEVPALVGLTSGFFAALAYFQIKQLSAMREPEWRIVFYFTLFGTVWGALGQVLLAGGFTPLHWHNIPALLGIGVTATLAQVCMTRSWGSQSTLLTACFQYTAIIFGSGIGVAVFAEPIGWQSALGIVIILIAGIWATWLNKKHPPKTTKS